MAGQDNDKRFMLFRLRGEMVFAAQPPFTVILFGYFFIAAFMTAAFASGPGQGL